MSATQWIVLGVVAVLALGYLLAMRIFFRRSRDLDKQVDHAKLRPWKDEDGRD